MVSVVNSKADVLKNVAALNVNCNAAVGLSEVMKSNLGPRGTLKMLVGGAGQIKITKDGCVLLHEMQIQHPTASMIARAATAQDDITGDGTTTTVLFIGEIMKQAERYLNEGVHPRILAEGFDKARAEVMTFLETFKQEVDIEDREALLSVARTSLRTKLTPKLADQIADICVDGVRAIRRDDAPLDLHMVEILNMKHKTAQDTTLVKGIVCDHGSRHPDMPKKLENCFILTMNVSLEYEKTEVQSQFMYSNAEERAKLLEGERKVTDDKCRKIIEFKRKVCTEDNGKTFVVINQKGIDQPCLDMMAKEGIIGLRRCKRRNLERLVLACGGVAVNSLDDLDVDDLGHAGTVFEKVLGEDKYTFIEDTANPQSVTVMIRGPNDHTIFQIKDALRDGLRAVANTLQDKCVIPGGGAFELAAYSHLSEFQKSVSGKVKLGVEVFANALLIIPKTLAANSGFDVQDTVLALLDEYKTVKTPVGMDILTGEAMTPKLQGVYDNYCVKRQLFNLAPVLAQQLILVDEVIRAGRQMKGG